MISGLQVPYNQFSEHDEMKLQELVNLAPEGKVCELGCWTGHSTSILARNRKVIVVDNFKGNQGTPLEEYARDNAVDALFVENMKSMNLLENIQLFSMDSSEAYKYITDSSLALLFIDAGHTYTQVKEDLINYIPKLKTGGMICGHDYESDTYEEAHINEDYVNGKHHGVIKAVNEQLGSVSHEGRMWWKQL